MNEMAAALGKALHRPALLRAPAFAVRVALGERADIVLTGQRAIPAALLAAGFRFSFERVGDALTDILATR
jgi:NAD dependent epimerase/dehydratase family enzyme